MGKLGDGTFLGRLLFSVVDCALDYLVSVVHGVATIRPTWQRRPRVADQQPCVPCNPLINFAVFSLGQEYHLPHHMFATVPHYRLGELHELLLNDPDYRLRATVVEGYFLPKERPPTKPTVVDVLGPDFAPLPDNDVFIDNSILEDQQVDDRDKAEIIADGEQEAQRARRAKT